MAPLYAFVRYSPVYMCVCTFALRLVHFSGRLMAAVVRPNHHSWRAVGCVNSGRLPSACMVSISGCAILDMMGCGCMLCVVYMCAFIVSHEEHWFLCVSQPGTACHRVVLVVL